jgi:glutamine phosphoribosylpyrophosphate amidotransferase
MCEQFVARASEPFRLDALWPFAEKLERFGIAGFGWGAAWLDGGGRLEAYRDVRAFRDDPARERIGAVETTSVLVHLRRPSKLSTLTLEDTQPFCDPAGRFVFSHNGDFQRTATLRATYRRHGRIHGRADTEVGQRWLEDEWRDDEPLGARLARLHRTFPGHANLAVLTPDGDTTVYAGNDENPVFTFMLGRIGLASTAIYSIDRSLFKFVAPDASRRHLVRSRTTVRLDRDGTPLPAS